MAELGAAARRVVHLARDAVVRREPLGEQRLKLPLVHPVEPVHRLLEAQVGLGGRDGVVQPVGDSRKIPDHGVTSDA